MLAVLVGGALGTGLRLGIDALIPHGAYDFPWSTLLINVVGSFALGYVVSRVWPVAPDWLRFGLGTGLLGSFTTFSAVMVSLFDLGALAVVYVVVTLGAGFGAAALGLRLGRRRARATPQIGPDE
jgi:CrcB protein